MLIALIVVLAIAIEAVALAAFYSRSHQKHWWLRMYIGRPEGRVLNLRNNGPRPVYPGDSPL